MKVISTKAHGILDYLMGVLLIASPWLFGFARGGSETWTPIILGAGAILYSLLTNYELSMAKAIPMRAHLTLDFLSGAFLAASPWILGFNDYVYVPHLIFGIVEIGAALMTDPGPAYRRDTSPVPGQRHTHAH